MRAFSTISSLDIMSFSSLLMVIFSCQLCSSFNFEPRLPIVKRGPVSSYFGFSVAEHMIAEDETRRRISESVMLVGAPKAQSSQPGTNHSGLVFRCPLSTLHTDCNPLSIEQDDKPPEPSVSKDDQWLGVSVKSQGPGGYVLTCAHRYVQKGPDFQWGQGICYSLTQYLDFQRAWEPCFNRPVFKAHEQYGYCQAGTSAEISEDNDLVIGTPGPFTWRGTIFTNSIRFGIRDDKSWYSGPVIEGASPVDKYSYLGMSVTSGRFFSEKLSFVGGAPRSNGVGQVIFYSKAKPASLFQIDTILDGEQFGSSFGYSITSLDVNGDRKLDLIVGAPFFYSKSEGGAVYVYLNSPESLLNNTYALRLTGPPESRFGFSLTSLGDINQDGFTDLAIGAPYEEGGGAVYIYLGSKDGIKKNAVQVIHGTDLPSRAGVSRTFGYALSGSMDLDKNGYPDLLVGAYEQDSAILLRARPIINIITSVRGKLTNIDPTNNYCDEEPSIKMVCFPFEACFRFNSNLTHGVVKLAYKIEAETFEPGKKYYRVKFSSTMDTDKPNIVEKDMVIKGDKVEQQMYCSRELVFLKDKSDIQNPVKFKLTYSLVQKEPEFPYPGDPLPDINKFPILNQEEAHRIFEARFLKDCGSNDVCESDLVVGAELHLPQENSQYILLLGEEHVNLTLRVGNRNEPAYEANVYITHPASLSYVGRKSIRGDQLECLPVNKTLLRCELGNPFPKKGETEIQLRFNPKSLLDDEQMITFHIEANTTSKDISPLKNVMNLTAQVVRVAELEIKGSTEPDQVFYGGDIKGESSMVYEEDIGSVVVHTYVVTNRGPWRARRLEVVIDWPYEIENQREHGKWLLYLLETQVQGNGYCETGELLNPLKLRENREFSILSLLRKSDLLPPSAPQRKRPKREVLPEEVREDGKIQTVVTMDCYKKTARCFKFSCFLTDLRADQTAVIKLRARLWNSTFVEDYAYGISQVHIHSHARIKIDSALDIKQQRLDNDFSFAKTKAYPDLELLPPQEAPLWALILAIILGISILIVFITIMYKLGFFERKKYGYLAGTEEERDAAQREF